MYIMILVVFWEKKERKINQRIIVIEMKNIYKVKEIHQKLMKNKVK